MTNMTTLSADTDLSFVNQIFSRHSHKVDAQDREDVLSDVFLRLVEKISSGTVIEDLVTYAFTVVKFAIIDYQRMRCSAKKGERLVHYCDGVDDEDTATNCNVPVLDYSYQLCELQLDYEASRKLFTEKEQLVMDFMLYSDEAIGMKPSSAATHLGIDHAHGCNALKKMKKLFLYAS